MRKFLFGLLVATVLSVPQPAFAALAIDSVAELQDGTISRNLFALSDSSSLAAFIPVEQRVCFQSRSIATPALAIDYVDGCDASWASQPADPKIVMLTAVSQNLPPCGDDPRCDAAAFLIEARGAWAGSIVLNLRANSGALLGAVAIPVPYAGYGYFEGYVRTNVASDYSIELKLLDTFGYSLDSASRPVSVSSPLNPIRILAAETREWNGNHVWIALATSVPPIEGCISVVLETRFIPVCVPTGQLRLFWRHLGIWSSPPEAVWIGPDAYTYFDEATFEQYEG